MDNYRKQSALTSYQVDIIRESQTVLIMNKIISKNKQKIWIPKKMHLAAISITVVLVITLLLTTFSNNHPTFNITYADIYSKIVSIDQRLETIVQEFEVENQYPSTSSLTQMGYNPDYYISKEALFALYTDDSWKLDYGIHYEYLLNVRISLDGVVEIMDQITTAPLDKWVDTGLDEGIESFKIVYDPEGYIILAVRSRVGGFISTEVFCLGDNPQQLDIDHIRYQDNPLIYSDQTKYVRYIFKENQYSASIVVRENDIDLHYVDFVTEERYLISKAIDSSIPSDSVFGAYLFTHYDPQNKTYSTIEFNQTEILSEFYTQYNEYGRLFTYNDNNTSDDAIYITYNLLYATGWTHASYNPNNTIEEGIYLDGFKILEEEDIVVSKVSRTVSVELRTFMNKNDLTNSILDLSYLDLYFNDGKTNLAYLDDLFITDPNTVFDVVTYQDIDFTSDTLQEDLYELIDDSMQDILRYEN